MELTLQKYGFNIKYKPSQIAFSSIYLALRILDLKDDRFQSSISLKEEDIMPCVKELYGILTHPNEYDAVRRKYACLSVIEIPVFEDLL